MLNPVPAPLSLRKQGTRPQLSMHQPAVAVPARTTPPRLNDQAATTDAETTPNPSCSPCDKRWVLQPGYYNSPGAPYAPHPLLLTLHPLFPATRVRGSRPVHRHHERPCTYEHQPPPQTMKPPMRTATPLMNDPRNKPVPSLCTNTKHLRKLTLSTARITRDDSRR